MSIRCCQKCGGMYATENGEVFGGAPCTCQVPMDGGLAEFDYEKIARLESELARLTAALAEGRALIKRCLHIAIAINDPDLPLDSVKRLLMIYHELDTFRG